jgi:sporulation protein YlmC with PRC-barrel domain
MIRKLLATTAIVTVAASGAYAAEGQTSDRFLTTDSNAALASSIIGEEVYTSSAVDADSVGEINDLLVGNDGEIDAAIVGVGGFLGLGEKNVAVSYRDLQLTTGQDGTYHVVLETSKEELDAAPAFDVNAVGETHKNAMAPEGKAADKMAAADKDAMAANDKMAAADNKMASPDKKPMSADDKMAAADKDAMATDDKMAATAPDRKAIAAGRQDYAIVDVTTMSTDDLIGASVYSYDNDNVGEIGEIVLTAEGKTDAVVIDVGGFLGIGEKPVAVAFEDLEFRADENGRLYVYTQFTQDQLESAAEYNEEEYKQSRDQMRVRSSG